MDYFEGKVALRAFGGLFATVLAAGISITGLATATAQLELRARRIPVVDDGRRLAVDGAPGGRFGHDIAAAYEWLRDHAVREPLPVLIRSASLADDSFDLPHVPHTAPLFTDLPLWCEWRGAFAGGHERFSARKPKIEPFYRDRTFQQPHQEWDPRLFSELAKLGRPAYLIVEQLDRAASGGAIEKRMGLVGCERVHEVGEVAVFVWTPPQARGGGGR